MAIILYIIIELFVGLGQKHLNLQNSIGILSIMKLFVIYILNLKYFKS
jgi:hypothetical protein